ncbi:tRNA (cytidine32/uridine32-2'-O)-methyltransferase [Marinobacter daqiaonensis]|uniref:tRNA (cytidine/uridine-2'-O-)-methyltransferase TrmJ n=1 Tax=Marinobacter daqiaonensis TaxID=650891 RepID=A0A1I6GL81_9GAMM|nr:tRNA (cytosine(32)/uridine(32)-2'-O)-methyltransferase TrmJ [Marinobacter daqiaonensis]SFR42953.1 tRNA (cytidine32/uridine32-2'-O)-methyltransferase [Marinobacter daqiaonensis]
MHKPALPSSFDLPARDYVRVVLVETSHSGNIGAVARAMKNMGLGNLWLVSPRSFPDETSYARAAGASDVLDRARVVATLDEAIADCVLVMGTSARGRKVPWPVMSPTDAAQQVGDYQERGEVALVFGRENNGLSNDELQRCHVHIHIPSNPDYGSLNVAMAVQVLCYEVRMQYLRGLENSENNPQLKAINSPEDAGWDVPAATVAELDGFFGHLEATLADIEFHRRDNPRQLMTRLRRLFQRARPDQMEINILRGVLSAVQKTATDRGETTAGASQQDQQDV